MGGSYLRWWKISGFDTGPTAAGVFKLVDKGKSYSEAAKIMHHELNEMTAGCNPMHRCPPLALCSYIPSVDLDEAAKEEARLTHYHPLAGEGSALAVRIIRYLLSGHSWEETLLEAARGQPDWILSMIFSKISPTSRSGYSPDVLRASLYFMHTSDTFQEALERSIKFAGPANYSPVLVGALAGARWGDKAIPNNLIKHNAKHLPRIHQLAEELSQQDE